jgi:hypothetical protein
MERPDPENSGENVRERRRRQPLRDFGLILPEWEDEGLAPPVEGERIGDLLEGGLGSEEFRRIADLILRFRSWAGAHCRLGRGRDRRPEGAGG